ncbi:MAG: hypothetical protein EA349_01215 [Halomonadaceae bacterium]|nr:MAG: hypothetical protein EA349_01215 [Halomonadaceae bacterium]
MAAPVLVYSQEPRPEVGEAPPQESAEVAVFAERGLLTPSGRWVLEPSLSYVHSSSLDVAIEGFTIIPAIAVGLIDVSETERDTFTAAVGLRYGISRRFEAGIRVPYVYREQQVRRRDILQESSTEQLTGSDGYGLGDLEASVHYQFNVADKGRPFFIGNLKVKSRTGKDPFDVERRDVIVDGERMGDIFVEQPTGSGFWSIQPSLTMTYPSDPVVIFGNISYLWNLERDVGGGYGRVDPGNVAGFNLGTGISLNNQTSISFGYDHSIVYRTRFAGDTGVEAVFSRRQVGSLLWGLSQRIGQGTSLNLSVGMGVTESAPDLQVSLRLPMRL